MNRIGKVMSTVGHLIVAVVVGLLDLGETRWLRKKLDEESEQVGRLI